MSRKYKMHDTEGLYFLSFARLPLSGGAPASVLNGATDVRRNAQQGGAHMLCTSTTGLLRVAQPDDASPSTSTYPLSGLRQALALQPVIIGPDRSTSTRCTIPLQHAPHPFQPWDTWRWARTSTG